MASKTVSFYLEENLRKLMTPEAKKFELQTWYKYMFPYIPFRSGTLASTMEINERQLSPEEAYEIGREGIEENIHFKVPYANRQYNGIDFNFFKDFHPLAQAEWAQVAVDLHWEEMNRDIKDFLKKE